ncbi:MAG TPA: hypothetical protein VED40_05330 [Azospirillaceae bacterium]|nr:hypothetical protein [Azospirillaceae bacterium]
MVPEEIDRWRRNIRAHTFGQYHAEMGWSILERENNADAAARHFAEAVNHDPGRLDMHFLLVETLSAGSNGAAAQAARARALAAHSAYRELGACLVCLRRYCDDRRDAADTLLQALTAEHADRPEVRATEAFRRLADGSGPVDTAVGTLDPRFADGLADALATLAQKLAAAGKTIRAAAAYDWLLAVAPRRADAYAAAANLQLRGGDYVRMVEIARAGVVVAPHDPALRTALGLALMVVGQDWAEAHASFASVLEQQPSHSVALTNDWYIRIATGQPLSVAEDIRRRLSGQPTDDLYRSWLLLALHVAGDVPGVLALASELNEQYRAQVDNARYIALALASAGRVDEGVSLIEADAAANPRTRVVWAFLRAKRGETAEATRIIEAAVEGLEQNYFELACLALLYQSQGRDAEADTLLRRGYAMEPKRQWLMARLLPDDYPRLDSAYRRLGLAAPPHWPEAPQLVR